MDRLSILTKYVMDILEAALPEKAEELRADLAKLKPHRGRTPDPITLNESSGSWDGVTDQDMAKWAALFPGVGIREELRKAAAYILGHPEKRKVRYSAFLTRWLNRTHQRLTEGRMGLSATESAEERAARRASMGGGGR